MFTSGRSRLIPFLLTFAMLLSLFPGTASAIWIADPEGTSATNPSYPSAAYPNDFDLRLPDDGSGSQSHWRRSWGLSEDVEFTIADPMASFIGATAGFYYVVNRSQVTSLTLGEGGAGFYYHSTRTYDENGDPRFQARFNIKDVWENDAPPGGWMSVDPDRRLPWEGEWYLHLKWYDVAGEDYDTKHIPVNIDMTPPLAVSKISARPSLTYTGPTDRWFSTSRAHVTWEDKEYDALSYVTSYGVYVDGEFYAWVPVGSHIYTSTTLENLDGGKHVIEVFGIDPAGNEGPPATTFFYSDPDTPTVEITHPVNGGQVGLNATFKADAFDEAGIQWVDFAIDGVSLYTDKVAPYQFTKNMSAYSAGTHTITAKTKDMYGREVSTTHTFTIDKTYPVLSSVSDYPDPFYPVLTDGYKDTMAVSFWCSEGGTATLRVYDSTNQVYALRSKSVGSGWQSVTWDGVSKYGRVGTGTFRYALTLSDPAGNATTAGYYTTSIYDYEIIRIAPNAVQVVPR